MSTPAPPPGGKVYGPFAPTQPPGQSRPGSPRSDDPSYTGPPPPPGPLDLEKLLQNATPPPSPLALGVSPGTLNLSLPSNPELQKAATADPWRGRDRFAAGQPTEITTLGEAFAKAGGDFEEAHSLSTQTQKLLAQGYTNDATPVYDEATHIASLPKNFPHAPARLSAVGKQLGHTATELTTRTLDAEKTVNTLLDALHTKRLDWETEWKAARNADGLIPFDKVKDLLARRATVAGEMQAATNAAGATVDASVTAYEGILADGMKVLSTIGYVPPDALDAGPGDVNYDTATAQDRGAALASAVRDGANPATMGRVDDALAPIAALNAVEAAGGTLTPEQQAFRRDFYQSAGSDTLAHLAGVVEQAAPGQAGTATLATVGNGIMNMSKFQDPRFPDGYVPPAVTDLLPGFRGADGVSNATTLDRGKPGTPGELWELRGQPGYEGVSKLLGASTVAGDTGFVRGLGESAISAEKDLNRLGSDYWMNNRVYNVDGTASFGPNEAAALDKMYKSGEAPTNRLLGVVARDATASQELLSNDGDRRAMLGAGWKDGTGAAAVLGTATAVDQASAPAATRSAEIAQKIFTEVGQHPEQWREMIPKGSQVSNALTELAADRIDTFGYPTGSTALIQPTVQNPDGSFSAGVRLNSDRTTLGADDRVDFLKFVATGSDLNAPGGDRDMQRIYAAANTHSVHALAGALREGTDYLGPLSESGDLTGVITRSQFEATVDQYHDQDLAAAHAYKDKVMGITIAERMLAGYGTGKFIPSPLNAVVKDPFNPVFDQFVASVLPPPEAQAGVHAAELFDAGNSAAVNDRAYLIAQAKAEAGVLPADTPDTIVGRDGQLRSFDQIRAMPDNPIGNLRHVAIARPTGAVNWDEGLILAGQNQDSYDPARYEPRKPTAFSDPTIETRTPYETIPDNQ